MKLRMLPIVVLTLLLVACGGSAGGYSQSAPAATMAPAATAAPPMEVAPGAPVAGEAGGTALDASRQAVAQGNTTSNTAQDDQRLVIKTANLTLEVENVANAETLVRAKVRELGGYVVQVQTYGTGDDMTSQITIRVPADQFDNALNGVEGIARRVLQRSLGGEDVTEEFVDLDSRLRNLEATRTRLIDLLKKATRVEDALQVNQALTDIQGQIEQIQGRMKYLKQSAAMSTITLSLQPVPVTPIVQEDGWQPVRVARLALRDLLEFGQGLVNILIVVLVWTPIWLPLIIAGRWLVRRLGRAARRPIVDRPVAPGDTPPAA